MSPRQPHPAGLTCDQLLKQCSVRRTRRSGPGGQHRNKVETAVVLEHRPTGVRAEAGERRSQSENQRVALCRLRINLALGVRSEAEAGRQPSALWKSRCRNRRIAVSRRHENFPALLAEVLDLLFSEHGDAGAAAERLECTPSQLVKLLRSEPRALALLNDYRETLGLKRMK